MDKFVSDVPKLISEWDYEKNKGIDPSKVKYKSGKKYHWKCQKGHQWQATCDSRRYISKINSNNCPYCNNKRVCLDNCLKQTHPKIAEEWHPYKNFPITPLDVVYGTDKKYWWYKKECNHEWEASCNNRTSRNSNCPYCDGKKICLENCLMTKFPEIAAEWHPVKNGILTSFDVAPKSSKKYWWYREQCGHEWIAGCDHRTGKDKTGCPQCCESKGERAIKKVLDEKNIKYEFEFRLEYRGWADFYLFDLNLIIEYQGMQHYVPSHFGSKKHNAATNNLIINVINDLKKENYCKDKNIDLVKIPFWELSNIEIILNCIIEKRQFKLSKAPACVEKHENQIKLIKESLIV